MDRLKKAVVEGRKITEAEGIHTRLKKDVRTKAGTEFKAGEQGIATPDKGEWNSNRVRFTAADGRTIVFTVSGASLVMQGFTAPPSDSTMEKWVDDGVAKSITGKRVEPDGTGPDGAPSWLIVLGMI